MGTVASPASLDERTGSSVTLKDVCSKEVTLVLGIIYLAARCFSLRFPFCIFFFFQFFLRGQIESDPAGEGMFIIIIFLWAG